jgi:hypothetical protein
MSFLLMLFAFARRMSGALLFSVLAFFSIGNAQAITIDFEDLNPDDLRGGEEGYTPLTNQYESIGVIFEGGAYLAGEAGKPFNFVDGPGFGFYFIHDLPNYVSMYVGSADQLKVGVSIYGVNGLIETKITDGGVRGINWEDSTPYRDNQFVSFFAAEGVSYVYVGSQQTAYMDNLSFDLVVPEPGILILFCLGLVMVYLHRIRSKPSR